MHEVLVAIDARTLSDASITWFDLNWVMISAHRERKRMEETIVSFRYPFANGVVRQVAIVTDSDVVVTTVLPGIQVLLHCVAVCTRSRIIAKIAGSFAVSKGKCADAR